jgi:hypothetical protein
MLSKNLTGRQKYFQNLEAGKKVRVVQSRRSHCTRCTFLEIRFPFAHSTLVAWRLYNFHRDCLNDVIIVPHAYDLLWYLPSDSTGLRSPTQNEA